MLLAGSAGSGKTDGRRPPPGGGRGARRPLTALYLSYSPPSSSTPAASAATSRRPGTRRRPPAPDFFTFGDLYRSLVPRDFREHHARPMTEPLFREWFRKAGRPLDPALVWEELRSILKGACLAPAQAMLDEAAYYELGKKRAPLFVDERPEIWRIAQRYQEWLAEEGRSDRIDLCRRAFAELRHGRHRPWDVVVCDEVQDLTELEVAFVLSLSRRPGPLRRPPHRRHAADRQAERLPLGRGAAAGRHRHGRTSEAVPAVLRLRRNLRSVRPLVELANALLLLRREVFGRTEEDEPEEAAVEGPVPDRGPAARGGRARRDRRLRPALRGAHPGRRGDRAPAAAGSAPPGSSTCARPRAWSSRRGALEAPRARTSDLVERFLRGRRRRRPAGTGAPLQAPPAAPLCGGDPRPPPPRPLRRAGAAPVLGRRALPRPAGARGGRGSGPPLPAHRVARGMGAEGDYFLERGHFRQAAECYRRAARPEREAEALARADEEREDWAAALARWTGLGRAARQAPLLDRLGRLSEAAASYREAGLEREARACEARLLKNRKAWKEAAGIWEALGRHADAARCWERAAEGGPGWKPASTRPPPAASCCRPAEKAALAQARQLEALGRWCRAAAAYRLAGRTQSSGLCRARALEEATGPPPRRSGASASAKSSRRSPSTPGRAAGWTWRAWRRPGPSRPEAAAEAPGADRRRRVG